MSTGQTSPNEPNSGIAAPQRAMMSNAPRRPATAGRAIFTSTVQRFAATVQPPMKITVEVMPELDAIIDNMAEKLGETKGTTILRALALLKTALDAEDDGERLMIVNDAENTERDLQF